MSAGRLRERVLFERATVTDDGYGGTETGWTPLASLPGAVRASYRPERGGERIEGGRTAASLSGVLTVRSSSGTRDVTEADRVVIDGTSHAIRSITNPDQRGRFLEMVVERGSKAAG